MGLLHRHTSTRAVWTFLRRTRERLTFFGREVPGAGVRVNPVIEAIVSVETEMLANDPDLPLRRLSPPKTKFEATADGARANELARRVDELEAAVRLREEQLAIMAHDLRGPLSPLMLLVNRLQEELSVADRRELPSAELRPRVEAISARLAAFVEQLNTLLESAPGAGTTVKVTLPTSS